LRTRTILAIAIVVAIATAAGVFALIHPSHHSPKLPAAKPRTAASALSAAPTPSSSGQFVGRNGTQLVLGGQAFRFTGFNLFGANSDGSTCGPAMNTGPALDQALTAWGSGPKVMRTWFFQSMATSGGKRDWSNFDHTMAVAKAHGIRVIATLGNQWGECQDEPYKSAEWYKTGYKTAKIGNAVTYRDWVAEVVKRYQSDPTIMVFQFMNEAETAQTASGDCVYEGTTYLRAFADDIGGLVHSLAPHQLTSLGTIGTGQCGTAGDDYTTVHASPGIDLCEYHDYSPAEPLPGDQWNGLLTRLNQCRDLNKPLFVGEVGIKLSEVGGDPKARAAAYTAKLTAGSKAGVAGELIWAWQSTDGYQVGPGDPALARLGPS
jgi:mannan endo-1,4-beta-mannosidase